MGGAATGVAGGTCIVNDGSSLGEIFNFGMEAVVALKFALLTLVLIMRAMPAAGAWSKPSNCACIAFLEGSCVSAVLRCWPSTLGGIGAAEAFCTAGAGSCLVDEGFVLGANLSFGVATAVAFKLGLGEIGAAADFAGASAAAGSRKLVAMMVMTTASVITSKIQQGTIAWA